MSKLINIYLLMPQLLSIWPISVVSGDNFWLDQFDSGIMGPIWGEKSKQFANQLNDLQQLVEAVFTDASRNPEPNRSESDIQRLTHNSELIRQSDPAMAQVLERMFQMEIRTKMALLGSETDMDLVNLAKELKLNLAYAMYFIAMRLRIPMREIRPLKEMTNADIMQELMNLCSSEKINPEESEGQKCDDEECGREKSRQKRILKLMATAAQQDGNWATSLSSSPGDRRPKRRRKRVTKYMLFFYWVPMILMLFTGILFGVCIYHTCVTPWRREVPMRGEVGQIIDNINFRAFLQRFYRDTPPLQFGSQYVGAFNRLPTLVIADHDLEQGLDQAECAICLGPLQPGTTVRPLPGCQHIFHSECIETWLRAAQNGCPICRTRIFNISGDGRAEPINQIVADHTISMGIDQQNQTMGGRQ